MTRLRVGVIGAGMITQIQHIPNLAFLSDKFELVGVADPSKMSRDFVAATHGVAAFETPEQLFGQRLDAVVIGSPDPLHHEHVLAALDHGLHVFCEKPLCYSVAEIDDIIQARDRTGKVVQVGYMKRFDPHYQLALSRLPGDAEALRYISVEVNDPDAWPFIRHHRYLRGNDVPNHLVKATVDKKQAQIEAAIGKPLTELAFLGFSNAYSSALVHDVNAVHGILDVLGMSVDQVVGAELFANGDGGQGAVRLSGGKALWNMAHLTVPAVADYRERISLYFDKGFLELDFPSPWLNHQPARLTIRTSEGHVLSTAELRAGYESAFVEELIGFWAAIVNGEPVRNPAEDARRDMSLLADMVRWHMEKGSGAPR